MTPPEQSDLMPCPFCGDEISLQDDGSPTVYYTRDLKFRYCECDNCGAKTIDCETEEDAIDAWNTRAGIVIDRDKVPQQLRGALDAIKNDGAREVISPGRVGVSEGALHEVLEAAALLAEKVGE